MLFRSLHVGQMTGVEQTLSVFDAVTTNAAKALNLAGYGIEAGCNADMVILQASDPIEAVRLRANRLFVIRRGEVIASTPESQTHVMMGGESAHVAFRTAELPS